MDAVALEARTFDEFERSKAEVQNRRRGVTKFAKLLFLYYAFGVSFPALARAQTCSIHALLGRIDLDSAGS